MKTSKINMLVLILLSVLIMTSCSTQSANATDDNEKIYGISQNDIHEILGEPSGSLSGFWGDIYNLENGTSITIYYDNDGISNAIKVMDVDGNITHSLGQ